MANRFKLAGALLAAVTMLALTASSSSAIFTSSFYPVQYQGVSSTEDILDAFGSTVKCTKHEFSIGKYNSTSEQPGKHDLVTSATETLTVLAAYKNCTAFGLPATVDFTHCDFVLHNGSGAASTSITTDLVCPFGVKGVDITIYLKADHKTAVCHVTITPFTGRTGLQIHNLHPGMRLTGAVTGLPLHQERTNMVLCPPGTETSEAKYTVQAGGITITGLFGETLSAS